MNDYNIHITGQCYSNHNYCNFCKYGSEFSIYFLKNYKHKPRFELDFINGVIKYFKKYWEKQGAINNIKIINYIPLTSKHKINKKIEQLNSNYFVLEKVTRQATLQFLQNIQIKNKIIQEQKKTTNSSKLERIQKMLDEINEEISKMEKYYSIISLHKINIQKYKSKYTNNLRVIAGEYICFKCHIVISNRDYKNYKHRFYICKHCSEQNINDKECVVCFDKFKHKEMVYMACGNGHTTCSSCYKTLVNYTNKCPMCRGSV